MGSGDASFQIRLLGGLRLVRDGQDLVLPASKKTRALLGYLVATGQPHRRERLCDLLWDGPDDPRAELRWSISKLRPFVNSVDVIRLVADREQVGFVPLATEIDLVSVQQLVNGGIAAASTARLRQAASLFAGEFLDGLDLPICYRYQEWCMAEREVASRQHRAILATLVERLSNQPEDALAYARSLIAADPLAEAGHAAVMHLLGRLGRKREALSHYEHACRLLESELGAPPGAELATAYRDLQSAIGDRPPLPVTTHPVVEPALAEPVAAPATSFVGREDERALIDQQVAMTIAGTATKIILVTGEPGIGKSHLLAYLTARFVAGGGVAFGGQAYEAEAGRPYGVWIDILREVVSGWRGGELPRDLRLLLPELGPTEGDRGDQSRLFNAVINTIRPLAAEQPVVITLDDIQWLDEASCTLLHYLARQFSGQHGLLLATAARAGEIDDNLAAAALIRSLHHDHRWHEIRLTTLSEAETKDLVQTVTATADPARIYGESAGNPLFTLELARVRAHGESEPSRTLENLLGQQLSRLRDRSRDLLVWAAALDRSFTLTGLAGISGIDPAELLVSLDELERHGLVRPIGHDAYDFRHDLIRQAAYRGVSHPRRTLIHLQIARALLAAAEADAGAASDAARHAALGNDHEVAVRACILAGNHALKVFAKAEARSFADRGARHVTRLPQGPAAVALRIALFEIRVLAATGPGMQQSPSLVADLTDAVTAAEAFGLHAAAATGHYLLSVLYQEAGDRPLAEQSTLRAAQAGRTTDAATQAHQLANTARCLLELETQVSRARSLVGDAGAIAGARNLELCELHWATGLLQRWDGEPEAAISSIERALSLARHIEDRRREYKCLTWLTMLSFELNRPDLGRRGADLLAAAARYGESETPFAETIDALAALNGGDSSAWAELDAALHRLRAVDDKSYLAYALNAAARLAQRADDITAAAAYAREALAVATIMRRQNEVAIARSLLARLGEAGAATKHEPGMDIRIDSDQDALSARARAAVLAASDDAPRAIPTPVSTVSGQH